MKLSRRTFLHLATAAALLPAVSGIRKGANLPVAPYHHCRALPCGWADLILRPEKDVPSRVRARATGKVEYRNANAYSLRQLLANAAIAASRVAS
jgi:hypothetical protein